MIYAFDEYELDTQLYELRRAGASLPLEPKVFDLLAALIQHRDRIVSKHELLEHLWLRLDEDEAGELAVDLAYNLAKRAYKL